MVTLTASSR